MRKTWVPNRKVIAGAVSGVVTLGAFVLLGPDADPSVASSATLIAMTVISYFVPLAEEPAV